MYYVLNNCGHVKGEAKKWSGYRHIALMESLDGTRQGIIRTTRRARVVRDATVFVGSCRGLGYDLLEEYHRLADKYNSAMHASLATEHVIA